MLNWPRSAIAGSRQRTDMMAAQLLGFFSAFFALAFFVPTYRLWRRAGVNALVLPADDTAHGYVGRLFKAVIVGIFLLLIALSLGLPASATGPLPWLESEALHFAARAMLGLSLAWIIVAQAQMGASWRVGIDSKTATDLVTSGIFKVSRNPIFLGMRTSLLGLFLLLPNAPTLAILMLGEALMQVQVRLEEAHLSALHGEIYELYRGNVRRWL